MGLGDLCHEVIEILAKTGFSGRIVGLVYDDLLNGIGLIIAW
jgi:ribosomal protein S28E/S33